MPKLRSARDPLVAQFQLQSLDPPGESLAAIELNSAIELLNDRPGATASEAAIEQMQRSYVSV